MLISENIHIISPKTRQALIERDENFIIETICDITSNDVNIFDLNVGPAKGELKGALSWLIEISDNLGINYSIDTTNLEEMESALKKIKNPTNCFINSANADDEKLEKTTNLASEYGCNLIALTMSKTSGIPKTPEQRLELSLKIIEYANSKNIDNSKIYLDPLVLPVSVNQEQSLNCLEAIRMFNESFEPKVNTIIGLSNISNGSPNVLRPLINCIFYVLARGAGLDCAIIDGFDKNLIEIENVIETKNPDNEIQSLYLELYKSVKEFEDVNGIKINEKDALQKRIKLYALALLNEKIYSHSLE